MTVSRKEARTALAAYLAEKMTSAQAVYPYQVADFGKLSPVVYVTSSSSSRQRLTRDSTRSSFILNIHTFVLYPSETTGEGYTEQDAEDILDQLEYELSQAVETIQGHPVMKAVGYEGSSNADTTAEIGGETYLHEIVSLQVTCF